MNKYTYRLIYILIILTPIFGITEFLLKFNLDINLKYLKTIKDFVFIYLLIILIIDIIFNNRKDNCNLIIYKIILVFCLVISIINIFFSKNLIFFIGFRTIIPFILFIYFYNTINSNHIILITKLLYLIQIILIISISAEYFFTHSWGTGYFGFNKRACGFFFYPSPASGFLIFSYIAISHYLNKKNVIYVLVVGLTLVMISSAMGFIVYLCVLILQKIRIRVFVLLLIPAIFIALVFLLYVYPIISGRSDFDISFSTRFNLIKSSFLEGGFTGVAPGYGSNFFYSYFKDRIQVQLPKINDSIYASIFWQYGFVPILYIIILNIFLSLKYILGERNNKILYIFLLSFILIGLSIPINEFFPLNILYPIYLAYCSKNIKINNLVELRL